MLYDSLQGFGTLGVGSYKMPGPLEGHDIVINGCSTRGA